MNCGSHSKPSGWWRESEVRSEQHVVAYVAVSGYTGTWLDLKDGPIVAESPPEAPQGKKSNWIQTVPGKGFNVILRFYGPLQSWFDQSWRPGEIEPVESGRGSKTRI